jgi:hypothetical protein
VANITAISILQGDGAGGFQAPEAYPVSDNFNVGAVSLVEGDYDSDGKVDLAVARSDGIALLQNDGSGRFQRKFIGPVASGGQSGSIVTSDFNRDGKLDLAVTEGSRVTTFLGDGAGGFTRRSTTQVDTSPVSLYVADFNNDGIDDLVTPTFGGSSASLLLGDGTGAFVRKTVAGFGVQVNVIAVGDFDRDGNADLVGQKPFINPTFADVTIFLGDGAGNFTQSPNGAFTTSGFPQSILVEDFNGDGKADLVVSVSTGINSTSGLFLLTGDGAGGLGPPVQISGSDATSLVSGDFNADGNLDIAGSAGDLAFVMLGDGGGNFGQRVTFPVGRAPRRLRAADFNGDGKADLATANGSGDATVLFNTCAFAPAPLPSLSVGDATANEGDAGVVNATFNVQLSAPSSKTVTVSYYALGLSAAKGSDFQTVAGSLTFNPGVTSQTFTVPVVGDTLDEFDEKFAVRLAFPLGANVSRGQAEGTIIDNDPPPSASVGDVTLNEGNAGTTAAAFNVSLSAPSGKPISLSFATADNSATAGADYQPTGGTLTFNPGETSKTIIIPVVGETVFETDETFFVNLNDPVNVTVARGQAVGLILNDDPQPAISVADASKAESNAGASDLIFTVTLSNASFQSVTVVYATADDTATSPSDYQAVNGTLTFAPGETARTISVPVAGDSAVEADEKFFVNLSSPFNATLADAQGVGSILNDDTSVQFSAGAQAVNETDGSIQVFITRVGLLSGVSTVNYLTRDGAASERSDYNPALGTLRFAPNETSKTVTIFITDDALVESPETFSVALSNPNGCAIGSPSVASITINSDDVTAGPNPADSSSFFVRQHYRDFLNREPDEAGLNFWTGEVEGCGQNAECREVKRINVSAAFFLSIEFQETGYFVYRIYKAAYGDTTSPNVAGPVPGLRLQEFLPDSQRIGQGVQVGIGDWQQQLEANKQAYLVEFVTRPRFTVAFPATLTPAQFVDQLNRNAGAVLSPAERDALVSELAGAPDQTQGRAAALRGVAEEAELRRREQNRAFVLMQYYGYLRRNPDDTPDSDFSGWKFWLSKLEQFGGNFVQAEMVKAFISSTEYRQRFGQP